MMTKADKGRDVLQFYTSSQGLFTGIFTMIFSPFAAAVEVFLRKDMGERYFNGTTFIAGLIVIGFFRMLFALTNINISLTGIQIGVNTNVIYWVWLGYIAMSAYHFMYQWYREATNKPLYSYYMGDSRLFFVGKVLLAIFNKLFYLPVKLFAMTLKAEEREQLIGGDFGFKDYRLFTYRFVEPVTLLVLGWFSFAISGLLGFWLTISGMILALHTSTVLSRERGQLLDIRDGQIFSSQLQNALNGKSDTLKVSNSFKQIINTMAEQAEDDQAAFEEMKASSPSVAEALANLNPNLKNL